MKRKTVLKVLLSLAFFVCFAFGGINLLPVKASISSPDINNNNYSSTYEMDKTLYDVIRAFAKQLNFNQPIAGFDSDIFTTGYNDYQPKEAWYSESDPEKYATHMKNIEESNQIKADLDAGILNLTVGKNAKYRCLKDTNLSPIKNITGLNDLSLDTVKTLILDDNQISTISATDFENLTNLQNLSLKNNDIKAISFNSSLAKLNSLDLSGNALTQVDLSTLVYTNGKYPSCNLSNNQIGNINDLIFPTSTKLESLNLNFNNLYNLTTQQIEILSNKVNGTKPVFLGVQSENSFNNLVAGTKVVVYNLQNSDISELNVVASYFEGDISLTKSDFYVEGEDNTICETLGTEQIETLYAPAGKIKFVFYSGDTEINADNFPALDQDVVETFSSKVCFTPLSSPNYTLKSKGKVVTDTYQEQDVEIEFAIASENIPNISDVKDSIKGAKLYSGFNGKFSKDEQTSLNVNSNGTFDCEAIAIFDGVTSIKASVSITRKNMSGIIWGLVIIVILFVIGGAVYYIVKWVREGGSVAPLTQKEIHNANRRKERKYGREIQSKYSQLDASLRNKERQNANLDDLSTEDLNATSDTSFYNNNEQSDYNNDIYDEEYRRFNNVDYNSYQNFDQDDAQVNSEQDTAGDDETIDIDDEGPDDIY